jgi:hypothetical protein
MEAFIVVKMRTASWKRQWILTGGTLIRSYLVLYNSLTNRISYMRLRYLKSQQNECGKAGSTHFLP